MELTGKCKEEFEKYLLKDLSFILEEEFIRMDRYNLFKHLPKSMRYGVLVDYFDSVGIDIDIYTTIHGFDFMIKTNIFGGYFETRPEARTASIEKANELRNEVLNK